MIHKLKMLLLSFSSLFAIAIPAGMGAVVQAAGPIGEGLCKGSNLTFDPATGGCKDIRTDENSFTAALRKIINIISIIIGIAAVIMIIFGGFKYITSSGNSEKVTAAKNTIIYAIIGLVIVALAQVIVRFVLKTTTDAVET